MSSFPGEIGPKLLILSAADPAGPEAALAEIASRELAGLNADVTRLSLSDYPLPLMAAGEMQPLPENAVRLARHIAMHDGLLLISGERNASLPAAVKNMIDWIAAAPGRVLAGPTVVLATLTGEKSGQTAIGDHLRTILAAVGADDIAGTFVFRGAELNNDAPAVKGEGSVSIRIRAMTEMLMRIESRHLSV